jgi:DNA-binding transcriptional ArsR family regulator
MESVFSAVADPTRRGMLARMRAEGPLSIKQLATSLPISRQAVTKHLGVLQAVGLVRVQKAGRERLHSLDSSPLKEVEDWLKPYAKQWDERLSRLQRHLEDSA